MDNKTEQYLRQVKLVVYNLNGEGIDLSNLRIKFSVKRSQSATPNSADIRVYNLSKETAAQIFTKLRPVSGGDGLLVNRGGVLLEAGYQSNSGVIFRGNIKQILIGRESVTDTYVDIVAGDGDRAYNFSIINKTLAAGSTPDEQIAAATTAMSEKGVNAGYIPTIGTEKLPRGKVMYGASKDYFENIAKTYNLTWSIQNEKIEMFPLKTYKPGEAVELTSKTGMIGAPVQTNEGVNVKCLLNPMINVGGRIKLDNESVEKFKINLAAAGNAANTPVPLRADGFYYVLVIEHLGDTRTVDWYSTIVCLNQDPSANPANSVQVGYGQ